jgi:hypothetical protein
LRHRTAQHQQAQNPKPQPHQPITHISPLGIVKNILVSIR